MGLGVTVCFLYSSHASFTINSPINSPCSFLPPRFLSHSFSDLKCHSSFHYPSILHIPIEAQLTNFSHDPLSALCSFICLPSLYTPKYIPCHKTNPSSHHSFLILSLFQFHQSVSVSHTGLHKGRDYGIDTSLI